MTPEESLNKLVEEVGPKIDVPDPSLIRQESARQARARGLTQRAGAGICAVLLVVGAFAGFNQDDPTSVATADESADAELPVVTTSSPNGGELVVDLRAQFEEWVFSNQTRAPVTGVRALAGDSDPAIDRVRLNLMALPLDGEFEYFANFSAWCGPDLFYGMFEFEGNKATFRNGQLPAGTNIGFDDLGWDCEPPRATRLENILDGDFEVSLAGDGIAFFNDSDGVTFQLTDFDWNPRLADEIAVDSDPPQQDDLLVLEPEGKFAPGAQFAVTSSETGETVGAYMTLEQWTAESRWEDVVALLVAGEHLGEPKIIPLGEPIGGEDVAYIKATFQLPSDLAPGSYRVCLAPGKSVCGRFNIDRTDTESVATNAPATTTTTTTLAVTSTTAAPVTYPPDLQCDGPQGSTSITYAAGAEGHPTIEELISSSTPSYLQAIDGWSEDHRIIAFADESGRVVTHMTVRSTANGGWLIDSTTGCATPPDIDNTEPLETATVVPTTTTALPPSPVGQWGVTSFTLDGDTFADLSLTQTLRIEVDQLFTNDGCNTWNAPATWDATGFSVTGLSTGTARLCVDGQENANALNEAIRRTTTWTAQADGSLVLTGDGSLIILAS